MEAITIDSQTESDLGVSSRGILFSGFSACRFMVDPQSGQRMVKLLLEWNLLAPVTQDTGHPYKLAEELLGAVNVGLIQKVAILVEHFGDIPEIDIPENRDQSQFS